MKRELPHLVPGRGKQRFAEPNRETADHNSFRVEDIDEDRKCLTKLRAGVPYDAASDGVTGGKRLTYMPCGHIRKMPAEQSRLSLLHREANHLRRMLSKATSACPAFHRASLAVPDRTAFRQADMADLSSHGARAAVQPMIQNEACTEPCAHGQKDHVLGAAAGTVAVLRNRTSVGIVFYRAWRAHFTLKDFLQRNVNPCR